MTSAIPATSTTTNPDIVALRERALQSLTLAIELCRAALIATLLPDPGTPEKRRELCEKSAGKLVKRVERKKMPNGQIVERIKEETEGGILHWDRETGSRCRPVYDSVHERRVA